MDLFQSLRRSILVHNRIESDRVESLGRHKLATLFIRILHLHECRFGTDCFVARRMIHMRLSSSKMFR
jgi:hypothetical protein